MKKKPSKSRSRSSPNAFDAPFAYNVLLPLAETAYEEKLPPPNANDKPLPPAGYTPVGKIMVDKKKALALIKARPSRAPMMKSLLKDDGFFGWVLTNSAEKIVVVAFRGTVSIEDWLHNIDIPSSDYHYVPDYGQVHDGFLAYYASVRDSVMALLTPLISGCKRLILTGHSLGGALTELAAPDILYNLPLGNLIPEVQNFAGPRVGGWDFESCYDTDIPKCYRVVNIWDVVPHLPPFLLGYEHVGNAVVIDGGFTLDIIQAHQLEDGYTKGLAKLIQNPQIKAPSIAARQFPNAVLVGRSP